jgi:curved DNA-binding protein CbpA
MHATTLAWCKVLGLVGEVSEATVKAAYRREMKVWHPDRHHGDPALYAAAEQRAKDLNNAYECLTEELEDMATLGLSPEKATTSSYSPRSTPRHTYNKRSFTPGFPGSSVTEVFVKSSNILSVGYDSLRKTLYIKFHDGSVYEYYDVPHSMFDQLIDANSHGSFAHRYIYSRFRQKRISH